MKIKYKGMKGKNLFIITACAIFLSSCGDSGSGPVQSPPVPSFPVVEVPIGSITGYTAYPVSIEGRINSAVRAKVSGYITGVLVDEGQAVKKGQPLFTLETASLSQDAEAARANVNAAEVEVTRLEPLVEKGIISSVQLETARARLAQARASFNSINANIDYATIKSPVDGVVGAIPFRLGSLVSPADPQPLTTVSDIEEVYAFFSMNESDYLDFLQNAKGETIAEKIKNLPPVELELVNGSMYSHTGEIETVTGQVSQSTGTVSFRAVFPNPNQILTNGNSGRIRIPRLYENVILAPEISTYEQQGKVYVYKVVGDSMAVASTIGVSARVDNVVVVKSGLEPGEKIVAEGVGKLRSNTPIRPQVVPFDSVANPITPVFK